MITAGQLQQRWRALPIGSLDDIIGDGTGLVLAPHPDDESLGCGGLIAACCAAGRTPVVAILTDGSASHPGSQLYTPAKLASLRETEAVAAVQILGLPTERLLFLREPDSQAPHRGAKFATVVQRVVESVQAFGCSAILAPWRHDPHCDHEAAARIASKVAAITGVRLIEYPVWGWTLPDDACVETASDQGWRLNIASHMAVKRQAIAAHASQYGGLIRDDPTGFQLPDELLRVFDTPFETFLV